MQWDVKKPNYTYIIKFAYVFVSNSNCILES